MTEVKLEGWQLDLILDALDALEAQDVEADSGYREADYRNTRLALTAQHEREPAVE
jgi:hypothetical protein